MAGSTGLVELLRQPAVELAGLVRRGEVRARELVEAALGQIEARRDLNAFCYVDAEGALAAADAVGPGDPRPFAGVPTAIKDLTAVAGQPLTMGSDLFGDYRPPFDAYVARRLREAGLIFVGRTASPEFGIVPVTEPRRFGPTRNPWDPARTPGGSSGGAAAAVAAGILPVAHGSDGGGSIRIPAACCGLVGLKPSRGRISPGPGLGESMLSTSGALTRTVADTAHLLDVMAGYEIGDATWAPPPAEPFAVTAARPPRPLRIALATTAPFGVPVDPICLAATERAARLLADLGHRVEPVQPPGWDWPQLRKLFLVLWSAGVSSMVRWGGQVRGRPALPEDVERLTWALHQQGSAETAARYVDAVTALQQWARQQVAFFFADHILLLTPALARRPLPIGSINTEAADPAAELDQAAGFTPFTAGWNLTGQPAISLPLYVGPDGLPAAVQLVGPPISEGLLLSVAAQLEAAHGWNRAMEP